MTNIPVPRIEIVEEPKRICYGTERSFDYAIDIYLGDIPAFRAMVRFYLLDSAIVSAKKFQEKLKKGTRIFYNGKELTG